MKTIPMEGKEFGILTVISREGSDKHGQALWKCKCACGNETIKNGVYLRNGDTKSCGCLNGESHGLCHHPLYEVWQHMKRRCRDPRRPDYKYYGGRGISVFGPWEESFLTFYTYCMEHGYKEDLEIDRIDNDGNYIPGNIRFVTRSINTRNRRYFNNTTGYRGVTYRPDCKTKWCAQVCVNYKHYYAGLYNTAEEAARAYDKLSFKLLKEEAYLNFPEDYKEIK